MHSLIKFRTIILQAIQGYYLSSQLRDRFLPLIGGGYPNANGVAAAASSASASVTDNTRSFFNRLRIPGLERFYNPSEYGLLQRLYSGERLFPSLWSPFANGGFLNNAVVDGGVGSDYGYGYRPGVVRRFLRNKLGGLGGLGGLTGLGGLGGLTGLGGLGGLGGLEGVGVPAAGSAASAASSAAAGGVPLNVAV